MKRRYLYFTLVLFTTIFTACANLEHINSFSKVTVKTLECYNDIGYTYSLSYTNYKLPDKIYSFDASDVSFNQLRLPHPDVDPTMQKLAEEADKVVTFYITSIIAYFEALAKLSDKDLVNYNFDDFGKSFKSNDKLKKELSIKNDDQIDAATNIAKVFANELMGAYRKRKIREVMINHNKDVAQSLETLKVILLESLIPHLLADTNRVNAKYLVILQNPKIDMYGKLQLIKDYQVEKIILSIQETQLEQLADALEKIKDEHQKAVTTLQTNQIDAKAVIQMVNEHGAEVYQLYTNIKTLSEKHK